MERNPQPGPIDCDAFLALQNANNGACSDAQIRAELALRDRYVESLRAAVAAEQRRCDGTLRQLYALGALSAQLDARRDTRSTE